MAGLSVNIPYLDTRYLKLDGTNDPITGGPITFQYSSAGETSAIEFKGQHAGGRMDIVWYDDAGAKLSKISSHNLDDPDSDMTHWQVYTVNADLTTWKSRFDIEAQNNTPIAQFNNVARLQIVSTGAAVASRLWVARQAADGTADTGNMMAFEKRASGGSQVQDVASSGNALIDFDPIPSDGTSTASFRFFRTTNTTGTVSFTVYKGDNTATVQHFFNAKGNSYVNLNAGNFGIGTSSPTGGKLHVVGKGYISTELEVDGDLNHDGTNVGFYGVAPVARQVLATGAGATVDQVITALQNLGLLSQS